MADRRRVVLGAAALAVIAAVGVAAGPRTRGVQRPVALVESDLITSTDLEARAAARLAVAERTLRGDALRKARVEILREELDRLIEERLFVQEGRRLVEALPALSDRVDATVEEMMKARVRERGPEARYDTDLRTHLREAVLYRLVWERYIRPGADVTPEEVRAYYLTHRDAFRLPPRISYRQIYIPFADFDRPADARDRAVWIRDNLAPDGHDFERWVRQHSRGPRTADGGLWKPEHWEKAEAAVREAVRKLRPGQISAPIPGKAGYTIVRVERVVPAAYQTFREAQPEIARRLRERKTARHRRDLVARLKKRFRVEVLQRP